MTDTRKSKMNSLLVSSANEADKRGLRWSRLQHVDRKRGSEKYVDIHTFSNMDSNLKESADISAKSHQLPKFRANVSMYRHFESIACNTFSDDAIADGIMLGVVDLLSRLPRAQWERIIGILDGASKIRLDIKEARA